MMECYIHPSIDYTRVPEMLKAQKAFILKRIRETSKSDKIVYPPLPKDWTPDMSSKASVRGNEVAARAMTIPGVEEAGWTMADLVASSSAAKDSDRQKNNLRSELLAIMQKIEDQQYAWPFRQPVDTNEVKDYLKVISDPIDLSLIDRHLRKGDLYRSREKLHVDLMRMVKNCKKYNEASSPYYECAVSLEKYLGTLFPEFS